MNKLYYVFVKKYTYFKNLQAVLRIKMKKYCATPE